MDFAHSQAFGCAINENNFDSFIKYSNEQLKNCTFEPHTEVDFIWRSPFHFTSKDIIDLASLNTIWGQELEKPNIALENISITPNQVVLMSKDKNPTIKILLSNGVNLIKFKATEEEYEALTKYPQGSVSINAVGTCAANEWNGTTTAQLLIDDYEIVGETKYYF